MFGLYVVIRAAPFLSDAVSMPSLCLFFSGHHHQTSPLYVNTTICMVLSGVNVKVSGNSKTWSCVWAFGRLDASLGAISDNFLNIVLSLAQENAIVFFSLKLKTSIDGSHCDQQLVGIILFCKHRIWQEGLEVEQAWAWAWAQRALDLIFDLQ